MIKLTFSNCEITTNGIITKGKITAVVVIFIENHWKVLETKVFTTKITLKSEDKFDLNKAYKYIQAKLERKAYKWALDKVTYQILLAKKDLEVFINFANKAKHIVNHDDEYLSKF